MKIQDLKKGYKNAAIAPEHNLPDWKECRLRVENLEYIKENNQNDDGDSLLPNPIHEFIYEYDDNDPYKSAWFMHRLETMIEFIRKEKL